MKFYPRLFWIPFTVLKYSRNAFSDILNPLMDDFVSSLCTSNSIFFFCGKTSKQKYDKWFWQLCFEVSSLIIYKDSRKNFGFIRVSVTYLFFKEIFPLGARGVSSRNWNFLTFWKTRQYGYTLNIFKTLNGTLVWLFSRDSLKDF